MYAGEYLSFCMMSASNIRLSLQDFNMPNTQVNMFPSQNDNSSVPEMVEINMQASNVVDNMDTLRDHQIKYTQEVFRHVTGKQIVMTM